MPAHSQATRSATPPTWWLFCWPSPGHTAIAAFLATARLIDWFCCLARPFVGVCAHDLSIEPHYLSACLLHVDAFANCTHLHRQPFRPAALLPFVDVVHSRATSRHIATPAAVQHGPVFHRRAPASLTADRLAPVLARSASASLVAHHGVTSHHQSPTRPRVCPVSCPLAGSRRMPRIVTQCAPTAPISHIHSQCGLCSSARCHPARTTLRSGLAGGEKQKPPPASPPLRAAFVRASTRGLGNVSSKTTDRAPSFSPLSAGLLAVVRVLRHAHISCKTPAPPRGPKSRVPPPQGRGLRGALAVASWLAAGRWLALGAGGWFSFGLILVGYLGYFNLVFA